MSLFFRLRPGQLRYDLTRLKAAYERARYGWSKWDIYSAWDEKVAKAIGEQLLWFADHTHGFPGVEPYERFEDWQADLRKHGWALAHAALLPACG